MCIKSESSLIYDILVGGSFNDEIYSFLENKKHANYHVTALWVQ